MARYPQYTREVTRMINCFIAHDAFLVENGVNERSITHKLAEYLQYLLPEWHVDCEYNRKLRGPKTVDFKDLIKRIGRLLSQDKLKEMEYKDDDDPREIIAELVGKLAGELAGEVGDSDNWLLGEDGNEQYIRLSSIDNAYVKHVYPDIIAHWRGDFINKIVIEVKIEGRSHNTDKNRLFDLMKLAALTDPRGDYKYTAGFFITLPHSVNRLSKISTPIKNDLLNKVLGKKRHRVYDIKVESA